MNDRLLRIFIAVYEQKSISKAAEVCFVSQPNISSGLKQLENNIGKQLFSRSKRGVSIQTDAHYLYPIAKRIISELNSIPSKFKSERTKQKIVLGLADSLPQELKTNFFNNTRDYSNQIEWDVRGIHRDCDLNLLVREWKFDNHLFVPMLKEPYVLCVPEKHPLAYTDVVNATDLAQQPFIHCPPCEAHQQCLSILDQVGDTWNTVANCDSKSEVLSLLIAGLGITFLPAYFIQGHSGFVVKPYKGASYYREIGLSYPNSSMQDPIIRELVEHVIQQSNGDDRISKI